MLSIQLSNFATKMLRTIFTSYKNTEEFNGLVMMVRSKCKGGSAGKCVPHP